MLAFTFFEIALASTALADVFDVDIQGTATLLNNFTDCNGNTWTQIYRYDYTLTFAGNNTRDISHWSLELAACVDNDDLICESHDGTWTVSKPFFNEPVVGQQINGIKWDAGGNYSSGTFNFTFYSLGKPTTVNWYAKDGKGFTETGTTVGPNCDQLIPVELSSFSAQASEGQVKLHWETASETENLGFHVYRSMQAEAEYQKITEKIIPGHGNTAEAHSYEFMDKNVEMGKTYYYKLADIDYNGELTFHGPVSVTVAEMPKAYALAQNYPNPFNPSTTIAFSLPEAAHVTLEIYSTTGQKVRTLVAGDLAAGRHSILWDATDARGNRVASGVYLYRLTAKGVVLQKKLVLAR
ncbi:MAG: T9SS C-terminal target domain-containing protein [Calditrichaeota bacterium]|nr:MAG: T9SS C-terminal target domain-containing protein [Calditrichota bacterium]